MKHINVIREQKLKFFGCTFLREVSFVIFYPKIPNKTLNVTNTEFTVIYCSLYPISDLLLLLAQMDICLSKCRPLNLKMEGRGGGQLLHVLYKAENQNITAVIVTTEYLKHDLFDYLNTVN